jgi:hypothetical protein
MKAAPLILRDVEDLDEIDARELPVDADLMEREPWNWKGALRSIGRVAKTAGGIALKAAPLLLRDEDGNIYDARSFEELSTRDFLDADLEDYIYVRDIDGQVYVLDARAPWNFGGALHAVTDAGRQVTGVANKAFDVAKQFGFRELEDNEERDAEEAMEEAREYSKVLNELD